MTTTDQARAKRIEEGLWGMFVADALAMPVHWYYGRENIPADFGGWIETYETPKHPHPESFMVGSEYRPDVAAAAAAGRPYDVLHDHARFYRTSYSELEIRRDAREAEHGNAAPTAEERYHYHHGLGRGENTLNAHLARVLMRAVAEGGRYAPEAFVDGMVAHMTTPGANRDPYLEIFLRRWFEAWSAGARPEDSAAHQRRIWSIGSHGGLHRPLVIAAMAPDAYQGLGLALEHMALTHRSESNASALGLLVPALHALLEGHGADAVMRGVAARVRGPGLRGEELFAKYRDAKGPGNIPKDEMWRLHMAWAEGPLDLDGLVAQGPDAVIRKALGTACYPEHGLPLMLFLAAASRWDFEATALLNANAGGDNASRGLVLGLLMGAAQGVPQALKDGLADREALAGEIEAFAAVAARGDGFL